MQNLNYFFLTECDKKVRLLVVFVGAYGVVVVLWYYFKKKVMFAKQNIIAIAFLLIRQKIPQSLKYRVFGKYCPIPLFAKVLILFSRYDFS